MKGKIKERVEKILRRGLASLAFANPKEPPFILTDEILSLLNERTDEVVKVLRTAVKDFLEGQSNKTFEKTMLGKNSPFEVTEQEWQDSSFSFDDILKVIDTASLTQA